MEVVEVGLWLGGNRCGRKKAPYLNLLILATRFARYLFINRYLFASFAFKIANI